MASVRVKDLPMVEGGGVSRPLYTKAEYLNLLANAMTIEGLDFKKARYVIKLLIDEGAVGYDSITDRFYKISEIGKDEEGDPIKGMFYAQNNKKFTRILSYAPKEDGAFYIRALPYGEVTLREIVKQSCDLPEIERPMSDEFKPSETEAKFNINWCWLGYSVSL